MPVLDRVPHRLMSGAERLGKRVRIVGGVVQNLNLEQFAGITNLQRFFEQALHDVLLVIERKLDGDPRQLLELSGGPSARRFLCLRYPRIISYRWRPKTDNTRSTLKYGIISAQSNQES
jgi:hypothetical protein